MCLVEKSDQVIFMLQRLYIGCFSILAFIGVRISRLTGRQQKACADDNPDEREFIIMHSDSKQYAVAHHLSVMTRMAAIVAFKLQGIKQIMLVAA